MYREIHVMIVMSQDSKLLKKSVERLYNKKHGKNISIKAGKLPKEFVAYRYLKKIKTNYIDVVQKITNKFGTLLVCQNICKIIC